MGTGNVVVDAEGRTHETAFVTYLTKQRQSLLRVRDSAKADRLFSDLPRKSVVSGNGASKSYRVTWEKVGTSRFAGSRYVFSVEESGPGAFVRILRGRR